MNNFPAANSGRPNKIYIAVPSRNTVGHDLCGELATTLYKMQQDRNYEVTVKIWAGFGLDVVRNRIVAEFLTTGAEFLLMIDDDLIPPEDLLGMADYDCDVVGALCYAWEPRTGPFIVAYSRDGDGRYLRPALGEAEKTGLREVDLVGGGCMMVHRRVMEALPAPWFRFETDADGQKVILSEDFTMCQAAVRRGFKVFLDTDRICGHIKRVDLRDVVALAARRPQNALFGLLE
jgi:hypothetical protein